MYVYIYIYTYKQPTGNNNTFNVHLFLFFFLINLSGRLIKYLYHNKSIRKLFEIFYLNIDNLLKHINNIKFQ